MLAFARLMSPVDAPACPLDAAVQQTPIPLPTLHTPLITPTMLISPPLYSMPPTPRRHFDAVAADGAIARQAPRAIMRRRGAISVFDDDAKEAAGVALPEIALRSR